MAAEAFANNKHADVKTRCIVSGYIRCAQRVIPDTNIPPLVEHLCLTFFWMPEFFTIHGGNIMLNDTKSLAENRSDRIQTVYGNILLSASPKIYRWYFEIMWGDEVSIGIDSSNKMHIMHDYTDKHHNKHHFYAYNDNGLLSSLKLTNKKWGKACSPQNIIKMELNAKLRTLSYYLDNEMLGTAFAKVNLRHRTYHMAVCLPEDGEIELLHFEQLQINS
eukprot:166510_1